MSPRQIVSSYYLIAGLYTLSASLIWGVNTLFLLNAGLDIFEVFLANSAFTAGMVLFEIPTGVVADTRGRRVSFLMSVAVLFVATLAYVGVAAAGGGVWAFAAVSVLLGLGFTFYSGAVEAWLVDALKATGFDRDLDRVFARGQIVTGAAMLVGTVSGGFLGSVDLSIPFILRAGLLLPVFAVAWLSMKDIGFIPRGSGGAGVIQEIRTVARDSIRFGWSVRPIRLLMVVAFVQVGILTWAFYAWQPYLLELYGRDLVWIAGLIGAGIALSTIIGNALVDHLAKFCGRRTTLLLWAAIAQAGAVIGVGISGSFLVAVLCLFGAAFCTGVFSPMKQSYLHESVPSEHRATVTSFEAMMGSAGGIGGQSGLGHLARSHSIASGFLVGGALALLAVPVLFGLRALGGRADVYGGEACRKGPCAGEGLPAVAMTDAVPSR